MEGTVGFFKIALKRMLCLYVVYMTCADKTG